jgi:hypothetical protein
VSRRSSASAILLGDQGQYDVQRKGCVILRKNPEGLCGKAQRVCKNIWLPIDRNGLARLMQFTESSQSRIYERSGALSWISGIWKTVAFDIFFLAHEPIGLIPTSKGKNSYKLVYQFCMKAERCLLLTRID